MSRFLFILPILLFANSAQAGVPSHCFTGEQIFFTCEMEDKRVISLCGAANIGEDVGYMQFRAGQPGHIEYEYPKDQKSPAKVNFTQSHYLRYQVDYRRVGFLDVDTEYEIFWEYYGEDGKPQEAAGLTFKGWHDAETLCRAPWLMNLAPLDDILPKKKEEEQ